MSSNASLVWFRHDQRLADNTLGWQWTAGCGAAAAPYFRIFNPVSQGEKSDPNGDYVRRWVPEIANLPNDWLHEPWGDAAGAAHAQGVADRPAGLGIGQAEPRRLTG